MAELSRASGIPVATIKFYLRERLLQAGERMGPNQARYGEEHLRRLRLIRGLLEVGGLSIATARDVIDAVDSELPLAHSFGVAQRAVSAKIDPGDIDSQALAGIDRLVDGWRVSGDNPGRLAAARVLETFQALGQRDERNWFSRYAAAALLVAEADLDQVEARGSREAMAETVVIGTVLGDALFSGLRRAAQEHVSVVRHPAPPELHHSPTRE
ncbi:DNA-binding transcriptional MerR regulator [Arthrobacter sp. V4I6]|uniref:MerR family transcriptional regulator n=1 Tax=unclassified Arthrobacter TaxID=235627 RepID=UPI00277D4A31|nr:MULTISPECIES: MerR family transcriptional regulator [unclassified Arthrobacter]MDQ0821353.1 DNA-binding transcriptional MerR regulator [Arthrobacter sp. V1I7]MDQ0855617.1 DNA-binding transcriptional MerR regulator [Arthrobacter sp. V4I6]